MKQRLSTIMQRIEAARIRSQDPAQPVMLLAVSKLRPVSDIAAAAALGLTEFGENRAQELIQKTADPSLPSHINFHFIGHLQSNKAKDVVPRVSTIHSIDSVRLLNTVSRVATECGKTIDVYLEVNVSGEQQKYGITDDALLEEVARTALGLPGVRLRGLMTMAPFVTDESILRECFRSLRGKALHLTRMLPGNPALGLSMGMTNDYELAIEEGSTLVRIGTALFEGERS